MLSARTPVIVLALVAAATCGACGGGHRASADDRLDALSTAIDATNTTRAAITGDLGAADTAVAAADALDEEALAGNRSAAGPQVPSTVAAVRNAATTASRLTGEATAYAGAIGRLDTVGRDAPVSAAQHAAIAAVVAAGRTEASALAGAATAYASALPTYATVVGLQQTWYQHANAGWFRSPQESGGAYQVARLAQLPALQQAQQQLAQADVARRAATGPMQTALAAARQALA